MADILKNILGGQAPQQKSIVTDDSDFADFASALAPQPPSHASDNPATSIAATAVPTFGSFPVRPYTKWYRVWERTTVADFYTELLIAPVLFLIMLVHFWGSRKNRRKAHGWMTAHLSLLESEFAMVGFNSKRVSAGMDGTDISSLGSGPTGADMQMLLKEKSASEYQSYASGRQNVAFMDIKIALHKRYNPIGLFGEQILGFVMESAPAPRERVESTLYAFDGKENDIAPLLKMQAGPNGPVPAEKTETFKSTYDGFVFAVVHKSVMKQFRDDRYDLSLTVTKEHPKLPMTHVVMSESAEISDTLLGSKDIADAIARAGDALEALIVSDMPVDAPNKLDDMLPRKRVQLFTTIPSSGSSTAYSSSGNGQQDTIPLFRAFIRIPDMLVSSTRFRPEAMKRVRATREEEQRKLKKIDEGEKADARRSRAEKEKKEERDKKLKSLSAEEQRKYLERERATDLRRSQKRRTQKA